MSRNDNSLGIRITTFYITKAIKSVHLTGINRIFYKSLSYPKILELKRIPLDYT